jgi:hypothetical protein
MRGALLAGLACVCISVSAAPPAAIKPLEATGLRSIAGWLQAQGTPGFVGADVADAMGIARGTEQDLVDAMQRGFREAQVLRIAQVIRGDTLLFMVQDEGEVYFYLSSVREGLRKALVSIPSRESVTPLEAAEAETNFRREVHYWEEKAGRL